MPLEGQWGLSMAVLKVFLDGQLVSEHALTPDHDFIAGRGESCDCVLRPERGISRQHFKVSMTETGWELESLSRYGELYLGGEKIEKHQLKHGQMFGAPPYEFVFEESAERIQSEIPLPASSDTKIRPGIDDDRTVVAGLASNAMMRLIDYSGQTRQTFSLQGLSWIGGRDISCTIFIDNPKISRRQFEIQRVDEAFFIRDLSSVNGTIVNGSPIASDQWTQLNSSDVIAIADWSLIFEIRDASFEQRVKELDPAFQAPVAFSENTTVTPNPPGPLEDPGSMPALYLPPRPFKAGSNVDKKGMFGIKGMNPIRLSIVIIALAGLGYSFMDSGEPDVRSLTRAQTPFDKLPTEKQLLVKQAYQLARDLYTAGKFEMANQKIDEIHGVVPYYEDSKELQKYIDNAIQVQRDRDRLLAAEEEEKARKEKVEKVLLTCRNLIEKKRLSIETQEIEACVQPALQFDPDNQSIQALLQHVGALVADRKANEIKQEEYKKMVAKRAKMYQTAAQKEAKGHIYGAIEAYSVVVHSTLPDPNNLADKAKRKIASLNRGLGAKQTALLNQAEDEYRKGSKREAVLTLRKAMRVKRNDEIEDRLGQIMLELKKEMQPKYQEAILEESVGSVNEAKKKWHEIEKTSVEGEHYHDMSIIKLKKYGEIRE